MADHSRFSHALGSAFIAKILFSRVSLPPKSITAVSTRYPGMKNKSGTKAALRAHVTLAALMQDIGELPHERALETYYRASPAARKEVSGWAPDFSRISSKSVFNLLVLSKWSASGLLQDFDAHLLAVLLESSIPVEPDVAGPVSRLRMVLDSELDADRLDYVYRDSATTVGQLGSPRDITSVISSYEVDHVRVEDPAVIAGFLNARIHMFRRVYMAPEKRLREMALSSVLDDIAKKSLVAKIWSPFAAPGDIGLEQMLTIDDHTLTFAVRELNDSVRAARSLSRPAQLALRTLIGEEAPSYEIKWVPPTSPPSAHSPLPDSLLADTRDDYARGAITDLDFFRVDPKKFLGPTGSSSLRGWIPELDEGTLAPGSMLAFIPTNLDADESMKLDKAIESGQLFITLKERAMRSELAVAGDTRSRPGFRGPVIHVSWCWADVTTVRRVVKKLYDAKIRYYLLLDPFEGIGASPGTNSRELIESSDNILIVTSSAFTRRFRDNVNGNIAIEMLTIAERRAAGNQPNVVVLAADDWRDAERNFPWKLIGRDSADFVGSIPLEQATDQELSDAVANAVAKLGHG